MRTYTVPTLILAAGLIIGSALMGSGFRAGRSTDRFVTVKGVAEREVEADLALWPLQIVTADNDLSVAQTRMNRAVDQTRTFLGGKRNHRRTAHHPVLQGHGYPGRAVWGRVAGEPIYHHPNPNGSV